MKTSNQFSNKFELYRIVKNGTGHDLALGRFKTQVEQTKILREEVIPYLKHNYSIKFPTCYKPTTFDKLYDDIASFNDSIDDNDIRYMIIEKKTGCDNVPLISERCLQNCTTLVGDIQRQREEITEVLDHLKEGIKFDIKRHWWGATDIESIENAIQKVHENLSSYLGKCGDALCKINDNQCKTLEFISILAKLEDDLYNQLDKTELETNVLRQFIVDWCRQQNINDQDIQELLDLSFRRSITFRDRIKNLRKELETRIYELEGKFENVENGIGKYVERVREELKSTLINYGMIIEETVAEQNNVLEQAFNEFRNKINRATKEIDDKKIELHEDIKQVKGETEKIKSELQNEKQISAEFYTGQRQMIVEQMDSTISKSKQLINEQETKHREELLNAKAIFENLLKEQENVFNNMLSKQHEDFEEAKKAISSSFIQRTLLYCSVTGIVSIVTAVLVCFLWS